MDQVKYSLVMRSLSQSIDEVRSVYCNINEHAQIVGIYPFESLKRIRGVVSRLGYMNYDEREFTRARHYIDCYWGQFKSTFLYEFERPLPVLTNSPYLSQFPSNYWIDEVEIETSFIRKIENRNTRKQNK